MINKIIKKILNEITSTSGSRGSYVSPMLPGLRDFGDQTNKPFTEIINDYDSALLDYDSLDGEMSTKPELIKKHEKRAERITAAIKRNPDQFAWADEAGVMNSLPKHNTDAKPIKLPKKQKPKVKLENLEKIIKSVLREATTDGGGVRGSFVPPLQPGLRSFDKSSLGPFTDSLSDFKSPLVQYDSYDKSWDLRRNQIIELEKIASKVQDYIKRHPYATFSDEDGNVINQFMNDGKTPSFREKLAPFTKKINESKKNSNDEVTEDLAVWFGKKKKPKGSSQPKGPWVDICRKVDGKHPPCGRKDADSGSYPKCRAAGVAGKMSDSQKRSACQQKRNAEKKDPQSGKGQKPVMTSYKPKKMNEDQIIRRILRNL